MKRNPIILAAVLLITSCATHYVTTDSVGRHLDGSRQVLVSAKNEVVFEGWRKDTLATPQPFDFRTDKDTMFYAYTLDVERNGWTVRHDSLPRTLQPEVTVNKHFRWFTTRYHYTARFPQLDSLPVPIDKYLTPDEQRLLFAPNELPSDWNGADLYSVLDKLNSKYVNWWDHCMFEKEMEAYAACCDSAQRAILYSYHDTLRAIIVPELSGSRISFEQACQQFPELSFISNIKWDEDGVGQSVLNWAYDNWDLSTRVLWRTELPSHTAEHLVSVERMIMGDYVIEEHSDVVNWWALALTLLLLAGVAVLLMRRK